VNKRNNNGFQIVYSTILGKPTGVLVDERGIPLYLAAGWSGERRHLKSNTQATDLYTLRHVYAGCLAQGIRLDEFLSSGNSLSYRQIDTLIDYLRDATGKNGEASPTSFNRHLRITKQFLRWAYQNNAPIEKVSYEQNRIQKWLGDRHIKVESHRIEPLSEQEIAAIRQSFDQSDNSQRNRLMFEMTLRLGLRRGEMLKLKVENINGDTLQVRRNIDSDDRRRPLPSVKTKERDLPIPEDLSTLIQEYLNEYRVSGQSDYLFTTIKGDEISISQTNTIIEQIGQLANIELGWHRMRHTFAENLAVDLQDNPDRSIYLRYALGHKSEKSQQRYIEKTHEREVYEFLKKRHDPLAGGSSQ
jgi:integrase